MQNSSEIEDFNNKILNKCFIFSGKEYYCNSVRVITGKSVIETNTRTIVLWPSDFNKIEILQQKSKLKMKQLHKYTNEKVEHYRILTSTEKQNIKDKFFLKNQTTSRSRFTIEEDELILTVRLNVLSEILGRKYGSLSVRRHSLKSKAVFQQKSS